MPAEFDLNRATSARRWRSVRASTAASALSLARMEIKVAAREIVKRLDNIKLAVPVEEISYLPTVATHSIARLPLTLTRRK